MDRRWSPVAALSATTCKSTRNSPIWWDRATISPLRGRAKRRPGNDEIPGSCQRAPRNDDLKPRRSANPDRHIRQTLDLAQQHVTLHHRADIFRRAGIDDVASL